MIPREELFQSTFFAYYPDNDPGERLLLVGLVYGKTFADNLWNHNQTTWQRFITQIERTKRLYEADRDKHQLS